MKSFLFLLFSDLEANGCYYHLLTEIPTHAFIMVYLHDRWMLPYYALEFAFFVRYLKTCGLVVYHFITRLLLGLPDSTFKNTGHLIYIYIYIYRVVQNKLHKL